MCMLAVARSLHEQLAAQPKLAMQSLAECTPACKHALLMQVQVGIFCECYHSCRACRGALSQCISAQ